MHDHAGRLVDDDQIGILVEDLERQRLGPRRRIDRGRDVDGDLLTGLDRLIRLRLASADADAPVLDQPLDLRARLPGEDRRQEYIEP